MDTGAWWATARGVAKSGAQLKRLCTQAHMMSKAVHFLVAPFRLQLRRNKYALASLSVLVAGMHCAWSREASLRFRGGRICLARLHSDEALQGPLPCSQIRFRARPQ